MVLRTAQVCGWGHPIKGYLDWGQALWHNLSHSVPTGKGLGSHHTQLKPPRGKQQSPAAHTDLFVSLPLSPTSPALLCSQHRLRLNFWPQNPHSASKQHGTPWDSHGGGFWQRPGPGTGNLAPSQDVCMGVLGQKLITGKTKKHRPAFNPASMSCARPPHFVGPLSLLDGAAMSKSVLLSLCVPDSSSLAPWWELKSRGDGLGLQEHPCHGRTTTPRTGSSWLCSQHLSPDCHSAVTL